MKLHKPRGDISHSDHSTGATACLDQCGIRNMTCWVTTETNCSPISCGCNNCTPEFWLRTELQAYPSHSQSQTWTREKFWTTGRKTSLKIKFYFFLIFERVNFSLSSLCLAKLSTDFEASEDPEVDSSWLSF